MDSISTKSNVFYCNNISGVRHERCVTYQVQQFVRHLPNPNVERILYLNRFYRLTLNIIYNAKIFCADLYMHSLIIYII